MQGKLMKKIILSNCWSYKNKGDASIVYGTLDLLEETITDYEVSALTFDVNSFKDNKNKFNKNVKFLLMPSLIKPIDLMCRFLYGLNFINNKLLNEFSGLFFIYTQIYLFNIIRRFNKELDAVLKEIDECDLFISVGGNYLWSHSGLYIHLVPMIYAKTVNKPLILLGHTVGPFDFKYIDSWMRKIISNSDEVLVREDLSKKYLKEYGIKNVVAISDMAFIIKTNINKIIQQTNNDKSIGVTVRKYLFSEPEYFRRYIESMRRIIEYYASSGYSVYIFPFSYAPGKEQDIQISQYLKQVLNPQAQAKTEVITLEDLSSYEILDLFQKLNFKILFGTRLHSTILAALVNIPSVTISYQHYKAYGITKQLKMEKYIVKMEEISYRNLKAMGNELLNELDDKKHVLENTIDEMNKRTINTTKIIFKKYLNKLH